MFKGNWKRRLGLVACGAALTAGCEVASPEPEITLVIAGQALIKEDPRVYWENPFGSLRPILQAADVAFTNFEMAVKSERDSCGVPDDYVVTLGEPRLARERRPGNSGAPHAVDASIMEFLATLGFNLMSIANNHVGLGRLRCSGDPGGRGGARGHVCRSRARSRRGYGRSLSEREGCDGRTRRRDDES